MTAATPDEARAIIARSERDPAWFVREILGDDPWPKQVEILESVRDHRETAVPACHASGKSWTAARIVLWFLATFYGSKVITTAPTERQVKGVLWGEIHAARRKSRYPIADPGAATSMRLQLQDDWWAWGFTAPDWDPDRFQGFHAPHILVVVDEASGIAPKLMEQIDSLLSGGHARKLQIGNPVESGGPFQKACESRFVNQLPISAFDTPNFTAFGITEADLLSGDWEAKLEGRDLPQPDLITPQWVAERLELWGHRSNAWRARVLGQFPETVEGAYFGELMKAAKAEGRITAVPYDESKPVGTAWDLGMRDATAIWFYQIHGQNLHLIDYHEETGQGLKHYAKVLQDKGYIYFDHIAPHDAKNRELTTGQSRVQVAAELGIAFRVLQPIAVRLGSELAEGIDAVRRTLPRCRFDSDRCADGIAALESYRKHRNPRTGEMSDRPEHDWASHGADAFRYLSLGVMQQGRQRRPQPDTRWIR